MLYAIQFEHPKYSYPDNVITAATLDRIVKHGIGLEIRKEDAVFIRALDQQRKYKKAIWGGGFLLSEKAAEKYFRWELSDMEKEIVAHMNGAVMMKNI